MKKNIFIICIALGLVGLFVGAGIFLQILIFTDLLDPQTRRIVGILISVMFIISAYRVLPSKKSWENSDSGSPEARIEKYVIHRWKPPIQTQKPSKPKALQNRRGRRSNTPTEDKLRAIQKWDVISRGIDPVTLGEFLASEFGTTGGELNVSKRTFYNWRSQYGHLIHQDESN